MLQILKKEDCLFLCMIGLFLLFFLPNASFAAQPESSYWFPEQLLKWSPEQDPNAIFNRSQVPLSKREVLYKVNDHAQSEAKLVALNALNQHTSGVPSQGGKEFYANTFSYWQYVDIMVYWAGSAGEGIIVPPSADVIDASHKNGVPILGTVFFPPTVYGGKFEWINQMLKQREDGSFPAADKLLEVAEYYGFDGWFINQETEGGNQETVQKMKEFLIYLQKNKPEGMHIMWYDSMTKNGNIDWQNALTDENSTFLQDGNTRVSDSMFLNFWWDTQESSSDKAVEIGRSPYDLFAGIDVEARGTKTRVNWEGLFPEGKNPYTSLGIYRPDWTYKTSKTMEEFYQKEQDFWVGENGDPSNTKDNGVWKGMAHYFTAKTPIHQLPFVTHFNTGSGKFFAVNGNVLSDEPWNNRSLQDILPTWRWLKEGGQSLNVQFDWDHAFYGGSSLRVSGELKSDEPVHLKLYKTKLLIQHDTKVSVTYKTTATKPNMKLGISFIDQPNEFVFFDVKKESENEWVTEAFKLKKYRGKQIAAISLYFESEKDLKDYVINIGEIKVYNNRDQHEKVYAPKQGKVKETNFTNGIYADVSLSWSPVEKSNVSHYEIYRVLPDGTKEWVGATPNHVYYLSSMKRMGKELSTTLEIKAVSTNYDRSKPLIISFDWPPYPKPKADFIADKTVVAPGEQIQFFNKSSEVTETVEWHFEGGTPSASTDLNPVVTYEQEGVYAVTLTAKNSEGEDVLRKEGFITVTADAKNMTNVALYKDAEADGQCAPSEAPRYALDGSITNNSKWCALGNAPHWLKVDLGANYSIAKFIIRHAESGGEPSAFNTKAFKIEVSTDGENWTEVIQVTNNSMAVSEHAISLTNARYVRLWIDQPTQGSDQAARIYEFEVYGY
jgi:endo-beta-N-acetylglucosaminidase D/PKD repeat protein